MGNHLKFFLFQLFHRHITGNSRRPGKNTTQTIMQDARQQVLRIQAAVLPFQEHFKNLLLGQVR